MSETTQTEGGRRLRTEALGLAAALAQLECAPRGDPRVFRFASEVLGPAQVQGGLVVPLEALDVLGPRLGARSQAAYLQLLRLSFGEGRNYCRVARRDLRERLALSDRALNGALDSLLAAGVLRAVHRDNRGTLYRVLLPEELNGSDSAEPRDLARGCEPAAGRGAALTREACVP